MEPSYFFEVQSNLDGSMGKDGDFFGIYYLFGTVNQVGETNTMVEYYERVFYGLKPGISHPNRSLRMVLHGLKGKTCVP